jgi:hypothetical protein
MPSPIRPRARAAKPPVNAVIQLPPYISVSIVAF